MSILKRVGDGGRVEVNKVEVVKIKSQTAKYKDYDFLLKINYRSLDRLLKQNYINTLI